MFIGKLWRLLLPLIMFGSLVGLFYPLGTPGIVGMKIFTILTILYDTCEARPSHPCYAHCARDRIQAICMAIISHRRGRSRPDWRTLQGFSILRCAPSRRDYYASSRNFRGSMPIVCSGAHIDQACTWVRT